MGKAIFTSDFWRFYKYLIVFIVYIYNIYSNSIYSIALLFNIIVLIYSIALAVNRRA